MPAGHFTIAAHRSNTAESAMPPWATVSPDLDLVCKLHQRLSDVCDVQEIDIVVVGIFHQVSVLSNMCQFPFCKQNCQTKLARQKESLDVALQCDSKAPPDI